MQNLAAPFHNLSKPQQTQASPFTVWNSARYIINSTTTHCTLVRRHPLIKYIHIHFGSRSASINQALRIKVRFKSQGTQLNQTQHDHESENGNVRKFNGESLGENSGNCLLILINIHCDHSSASSVSDVFSR